ncbi:MAG: 2,3-butanediol dehydrogenase [Micrococcaceae bacterium]
MRAARFYNRGDIRVDEIKKPKVKAGQVGIDVAWCGICGTDLHEFMDGPIFCPSADNPNTVTGETPPVTLGHEMSGVVNEVGEGVKSVKVGDHVVVEPYILPEGTDTGSGQNYHLDEDMNFIGLGGNGGGLGEKIAVEERWVHKIPEDMPLDQAALIEPLTVGYHAVDRANLQEESVALVVGAGPIGLLTSAVLKAEGHTVIISEPSSLRLKKAKETGVADHFINPAEDDVDAKVKEVAGKGVDVAFECTSVQPGFDACLNSVRKGGTIVVVAIWGKPASVDMAQLVIKEVNMVGTIAYCNNHPDTIKLAASGKIDLDKFITGKIGLDHLIDEGFDTLINRNETAVKILVSPSGKGL